MRITTLALLGLTLVACRDSGSDDDNPGTPDAATDATGGAVRIQDVQNDSMPVGTAVTLQGVVVTAVDAFGARTGDFWVQDPAGGQYSGLKVFGASLTQVSALVAGDVVDITGAVKEEFALSSDTSGRKVTELKPASQGSMQITKVGSGQPPAPVVVDAVAIAALDKAAREAEWEKWEGVLITVKNARQIAASRSFGQGPDQAEFRITGVARVQSVLTELPAGNAFGVCYDSVTGIGDYFFNDLLLPRSAADVVPAGTGCKPMPTSVVALQTETNIEVVNLSNVVVTARDDLGTNSKGFWIADALQAAPSNGVLVFTRDVAAPATYVPGATVNVQGAVTEFDLGNPPAGDTLTEITDSVHVLVAGPTALPAPVVATAEVVGDIGAPGEPYEGVLVQVSNVKVTNVNAGAGKVELTDTNGKKLIMDDEAFDWPDQTLNTCYATLVGVMSVQVNDNVRTINPRSAADMVVGTGCIANAMPLRRDVR